MPRTRNNSKFHLKSRNDREHSDSHPKTVLVPMNRIRTILRQRKAETKNVQEAIIARLNPPMYSSRSHQKKIYKNALEENVYALVQNLARSYRQNQDGTILYRVRWKGYLDVADKYLLEEDLRNCQELLADFRQELQDGSKLAWQKRPLTLNEKERDTVSRAFQNSMSNVQESSTSHLSFSRSLEILAGQADIISSLAEEHNGLSLWSDIAAAKVFQQTQAAASSFYQLFQDTNNADVLSHLINWELGRSFLTLFHWFTSTWLVMVSTLFNYYWYQGQTSVLKMSLKFGKLVIHVYQYVKACAANSHQHSSSSPNSCPNCTVSTDSFPLLLSQSTLAQLPAVESKYLQGDLAKLYAGCRKALTDFIYENCFRDLFKNVDASMIAKEKVKDFSNNPSDYPAARIGQAILEDPQSALALFQVWLKSAVSSQTVKIAGELADAVHQHAQQTLKSSAHRRRFNPKPQGQNTPTRVYTMDKTPLQSSTLIPNSLHLSIPALLIREDLNTKCKSPPQEETIARVKKGLPPHAGQVIAKDFNPDNFNLVQSTNEYAVLFSSVFSRSKITTKAGISSVLAYMASGHGFQTWCFIAQYSASLSFQTLKDCILLSTLDDSHYGPSSDPRVWGQYCSLFSVKPSREESASKDLEAKFAPYFDAEVQNSWEKLLRDSTGEDSTNSSKISWTDARNWLQSQKLPGFQSGMTFLQFLNNLSFTGVVEPPSVEEMADWINKNRILGAYRGLKHLGYDLDGTGRAWTIAAFTHFYEHLNQNLTQEDQKALHFGPIFVEHLLCKMERFEKALQWKKKSNMDDITTEAVHHTTFSPGTNL
ncbi:hypothetical protein JVT61DRAFT_10332 [Boletus reticuloceps]|uniref:Chromo domain-containing protein n=1 Tax=Boletus reticuloceps TaxID=495285 RepID=A0A8I2YZ36_9AGAM|nr:hypothetical protein JVT61DRAFT_10332 [Boletus reticuloceps]